MTVQFTEKAHDRVSYSTFNTIESLIQSKSTGIIWVRDKTNIDRSTDQPPNQSLYSRFITIPLPAVSSGFTGFESLVANGKLKTSCTCMIMTQIRSNYT